jgi:propionate CoA-transferase
MKNKIVTAAEAAAKIPDGAFIAISGVGPQGVAQEVYEAVSNRFESEGHPKDISLIHSGGNGSTALFAKDGMMAAYYSGLPNLDSDLMAADKFPVYSLSQGIAVQIYRAQANDTPFLTKAGGNTFLDPRIEAGAANGRAKAKPIVEVATLGGEEYLHYQLPKITCAIIRATTADAEGNLVNDEEQVKHELLYLAMAAHNNGGIVIAQVKYLAKDGSLDGGSVKVPGMLVDYVVPCTDQAKYHMPLYSAPFSRGQSGFAKTDESIIPFEMYAPDGERLAVVRRAAAELWPGCVCNIGIGMPVGISYVVSKEGVQDMFVLSNELGAVGGHLGGGFFFPSSFNARAYLNHHEMFDFINGHGLDITFLGAAEVDEDGSVNVTRIGGKIKGSGGFVNIAASTPKVVFISSMTIGGKHEVGGGAIKIAAPGKGGKFLKKVDQISFNGNDAAKRGQEVWYVTERAVFKLIDGKVTLMEYADGLDVERDILAFMDFKPEMSPELKPMPKYSFETGPIGLKEQWLKQISG